MPLLFCCHAISQKWPTVLLSGPCNETITMQCIKKNEDSIQIQIDKILIDIEAVVLHLKLTGFD